MKYEFIIIPLLVVLITQLLLKPLINAIKGNFSWKNILSYGGMPSAHSALVSSLTTLMALSYGFDSAECAISLFFALIVITDTMGLRGYITEQGKAINKLIIDLPDELEYKYRAMNERVAHTLPQVLVGVLIGIILTYILH